MNYSPVWGAKTVDRFVVFFYLNDRRMSIKIMILLRILGALLAFGSSSLTFLIAVDRREYFTYYSHWCMIMAIGMFAFGIYSSVAAHKQDRMMRLATTDAIFASNDTECDDCLELSTATVLLNWYHYVQWSLNNLAISSNLVTSIVYFMMLNNSSTLRDKNFTTIVITSAAHIINSLAVIGELIMGAVPVRLSDIYQPLAFTILYGIFYLAYKSITGREIYSFITSADEMVFLATVMILLQIVIYCLTYCFDFIKCRCKKFIVQLK
ncbi:ORF-115 [Buzura suppressaria nucleopolyhedrovirus]|uniref:ORF-115 n=1 Tax=Buzura suppressaria nuclear polyhedrosis virus TaxID=74320 RepID=W5VLD9_NPVBS|nr:ORF-115 [Buzura suppressaria nucleopolyhedrovirus]AHH82704.1 ORF-115 [Buzura suppressaria nucleopolyhedrovirus]AKN91088.1 ORF-118 [Buzura suppressaria nucleopolyhedrovirus]QYF10582.1 hypothetical protein [Buzura suppressaria nucleopolyhedrovirus]